ncbi:MAG: sodium/glutamate symporter [Alphaproteobacteria bacterium]|nr:sodium/glutamate symporter [Alphaproteobacteria bacterium]
MLSILVLYLGMFLNRKIRFLSDYYIPPAVTGGLICSAVVALIYSFADLEIRFDLQLRDILLLVFFSTIGISAKFRTLVAGGKALALLTVIAGVFLVVQDITGIGLAMLLGVDPGFGLMGGSVSLAGGHGTAIAWSDEAAAAGLEGANEIGIAFATFGLIAGGLLGGPIAKRLITKHKLRGPEGRETTIIDAAPRPEGDTTTLFDSLTAILVLTICVALGGFVNEALFEHGVVLPGFLTSMFVGIVITNLSDVFRFRIHRVIIDRIGDVSLNIFLSMSLMSMQLWILSNAAVAIVVVLMIQVLVMTLFAVLIVFRAMGRDYDASVITAGFVGLGLGATPVAIANMDSITRNFGPSSKAFLVVPLVGAFFIDILNAATIKFFIEIISKWLT